MRARLLLLPVLALVAMALYMSGGGAAAPDPTACTGYPEPRIYLENQSWWTPQPGPDDHPGTGKTGHIHVGMCFPIYQTITSDTLHLDVTIKLHNMPGRPEWLRFTSYNDTTDLLRKLTASGGSEGDPAKYIPPCATDNCTYTIPWDIPLTASSPYVGYYQNPLRYNGWHEFAVYLNVDQTNGAVQRNWQRFYVNVQLPGLPEGTPGANDDQFGTLASIYSQWAGGDSWYSGVDQVSSKYSRSDINRASIPWNEATGELVAVPPHWTPKVRLAHADSFVFIDPDLHGNPPSNGTVVYQGPGGVVDLSIDTTVLTNGVHKLLIGSGNVMSNGENAGVLVVPFLVHNVVCT